MRKMTTEEKTQLNQVEQKIDTGLAHLALIESLIAELKSKLEARHG
jgi:hypothetical protein